MISFKQVQASYTGGKPILHDIDLDIMQGEFIALIGSNGAGKSTLLRLFNGILKPSKGEVSIEGKSTHVTKTSELAQTIGFLFQNPDRQICCNTIAEELAFGLKGKGLEQDEIDTRVGHILEDFGFDGDKDPFSLSRSERQRIALASVIILNPRIIVLDEPTTGLGHRECVRIMDRVRTLNENGTTVVMVCHDMEFVLDYAQRVIVLSEGRIIADKPAHEAFRDRDVMQKASILPPQMIELGSLLGSCFREIDGVDEMSCAIMDAAKKRKCS